MAREVVLHVGAMKSGTTYLQSVLFAHQAELAARGVLVPGDSWPEQAFAVREVSGWKGGGDAPPGGRWAALVEQVRAHPGRAVVSMEYLGTLTPAKARYVVSCFEDADVRVVVTARDLNRSLAAMWQETVQNGRWWDWHDYLAAAERGRPRKRRRDSDLTEPARRFWRQQDLVRIAGKWADLVGPANLTLVTVPPPGAAADELLQRFAHVAGLDAAGLVAVETPNASIGAASALVLRAVNEVLAERVPWPRGERVRKNELAKVVLAGRSREEPRIGLPVSRWVRRHAASTVRQLRGSGIALAGNWSDLDPVPVPGVDPATVAEAEQLAAARAGIAGLRDRLAAEHPGAAVPPVREVGTLAEAVRALADLVEWGTVFEESR